MGVGITSTNPRGCLKPNDAGGQGASSSCAAPAKTAIPSDGPSDPDDDDPDGGDSDGSDPNYEEEEEEEDWYAPDAQNAQLRATRMLCRAMQSIAGRNDSSKDSKKVRKEAEKIELGNLPDAANLWSGRCTPLKL